MTSNMAYRYCTVAFLQMMKESNIATCRRRNDLWKCPGSQRATAQQLHQVCDSTQPCVFEAELPYLQLSHLHVCSVLAPCCHVAYKSVVLQVTIYLMSVVAGIEHFSFVVSSVCESGIELLSSRHECLRVESSRASSCRAWLTPHGAWHRPAGKHFISVTVT